MFKIKYVDYIMMLVRLDLNLIVSLFQHKCEVSETVSTTTLADIHASKPRIRKTICHREPTSMGKVVESSDCTVFEPWIKIVALYFPLGQNPTMCE